MTNGANGYCNRCKSHCYGDCEANASTTSNPRMDRANSVASRMVSKGHDARVWAKGNHVRVYVDGYKGYIDVRDGERAVATQERIRYAAGLNLDGTDRGGN